MYEYYQYPSKVYDLLIPLYSQTWEAYSLRYAGAFKCSAQILATPHLAALTGIKIVEVSISEAGGGKDITDSKFQKAKLDVRSQVNADQGDATNAEQLNEALESRKVLSERSSNISRVVQFDRPKNTPRVKKGVMEGITKLYHWKCFYDGADDFTYMRMFAARGIGEGLKVTAEDCRKQWENFDGFEGMDETLTKASFAKSVSEETVGLLKGEDHKKADVRRLSALRKVKEEKKAKDIQAKEDEKRRVSEGQNERGLYLCEKGCFSLFRRLKCFQKHVDGNGQGLSVCQLEALQNSAGEKNSTAKLIFDLLRDESFCVAVASMGGVLCKGDTNGAISQAFDKWLMWIFHEKVAAKMQRFRQPGWAVRPPPQGGGRRRTPDQNRMHS